SVLRVITPARAPRAANAASTRRARASTGTVLANARATVGPEPGMGYTAESTQASSARMIQRTTIRATPVAHRLPAFAPRTRQRLGGDETGAVRARREAVALTELHLDPGLLLGALRARGRIELPARGDDAEVQLILEVVLLVLVVDGAPVDQADENDERGRREHGERPAELPQLSPQQAHGRTSSIASGAAPRRVPR